jgi:hypothetical protein
MNNPLNLVDLTGEMFDWIYNPKTKEYVWDENVTNAETTPEGFEYVGTSTKDVATHFENNNPVMSLFTNPTFGENRTPWNGEISAGIDNMTRFEMWLDSPSNGVLEGIGKVAANIAYNIFNSPYSLFTGKTIGGTSINSVERTDAFIDFAPGLISAGFSKTGQIVKTGKGLKGYNTFVKSSPGITEGANWQKHASRMFQNNKVNYQGIQQFDIGIRATSIMPTINYEFRKKK